MTMPRSRRVGWVLWGWCAVVLAVGLIGCSEDDGDDAVSLDPWFVDDYLAVYTEVADCRLSIDGHNPNTILVHITPEHADAYRNGEQLGEGCIIVKSEYAGIECSGPPDRITVMRKGPAGTAPVGNWEWQEFIFTSGQRSEREGLLDDCISCHRDECGPGSDYTCIEQRI